MSRRRSYSRRKRRHKLRPKRLCGKAANIRGDTVAEQAAKVFAILKQEGKIWDFKKFAKHSTEDQWGWDFIITIPDQRQIPIDVTTNNPRTLAGHLKSKPGRKERLVIPVDIFTPLEKLVGQIWQAIKNYKQKLPPFSYLDF